MASGDQLRLSHGEMLYVSTGRMVLGELAVALISSATFIVLTVLVMGGLQNGWEEPTWEWQPALAVADAVGATLLEDAWSLLGVFATVLVAVALAGRGTFTPVEFQDTAVKTHAGLLKGGTDRRLSLRIVGRIGTFCGLYLAFACVLIMVHVVYGTATGSENGAGRAAIVVPVMAGGLLLAARIGAFVSDVETQLSELRRTRAVLTMRCYQLRRRIAPMEEASSPLAAVRLIVAETLVLLLVPTLILAESAVLLGATEEMLTHYLIFLFLTTLLALITVMTPWMTDVLEGWSEKAFMIWWWCIAVLSQVLWSALSLQLFLLSGGWASASLVVAAIAYGVQILWHARRYVAVRRAQRTTEDGDPSAHVSPSSKAVSPFFTTDRVVLGDRMRQLHRVEQQILDLEKDRGGRQADSLSRRARRRPFVPRRDPASTASHP
ncbi:hypothetical protein [uncultured Brachybacterium sp.]|uniref:hypothetical protein n=1 Tax=uncultured Brachybacterium sp. TaxID=189680 RepID=UPI0026229CB5|nr:hypothetical protein [uncultured Brachybacterium sp.]